MNKIISITLIILMIMGIVLIPTKASASFEINSASLYSKGVYSNYLHYGDIGIVFNYVVYEKDGIEYPAYCLNKDLDGVTESSNYTVSTDEALSNVNVWRTIINGYPYKTAKELGCFSNEEAFIATKQAVYCMLYDRSYDEYKAENEQEQRVLDALIQIVDNAKSSSGAKQSPDLTIKDVTNGWIQDKTDGKYVSKEFTVLANAPIDSYFVSLDNLEDVKITDEQNEEKDEFLSGENFKILIPISNLNKEGSFEINAKGKVATKPILYGYSENRSMQDYAITGSIYEEGQGLKKENYPKNETKLIILKVNDDKKPLKGVKFNILNDKKEVVFPNLETDINGEIVINSLIPGKYIICEISSLNGYKINDKQIEVEVLYNEKQTVTVTNAKEIIEVEKPEEPIRLPKTGM